MSRPRSTPVNQEQQDSIQLERLEKAVAMVQTWAPRAQGLEVPEPGSPLAADDLIYPPHPASTMTWFALTSALDHLDLGAQMLQADNVTVLRPHAFYSLTRSALLAASQCAWVLCGTNDERAVRSLLVSEDEAKHHRTFLKSYLDEPFFVADSGAAIAGQMRAHAEHLTARISQLRAHCRARGINTRFESTTMIKDVARHIAPDDPTLRQAILDQWIRGSAAAHARMWRIRFTGGEDTPLQGGGLHRKVTSSVEDITTAYVTPVLVLREAISLWDVLRTRP